MGLLLGELVRRQRRPQPAVAHDAIFLALAAIAATGFLVVGYLLRYTYATASNDGSQIPNSPAIQAAALTMLAFTGIVLAFTSGYYRESFETLALRRRLGTLRGRLRTRAAASRRDPPRGRDLRSLGPALARRGRADDSDRRRDRLRERRFVERRRCKRQRHARRIVCR